MQKDKKRNLKSQSTNYVNHQVKKSASMTNFSNLKNVLSLWPRLNILGTSILSETHMVMAVTSTGNTNTDTFIVVKKNGDVYRYDTIPQCNGIENNLSTMFIKKSFAPCNTHITRKMLKSLCGQNIKTFIQNHKNGLFALTNEGKVYSWGNNNNYTLGHQQPTICFEPIPVISLSNKNIVDISCGMDHTLALTADGKVYTWGQSVLAQIDEVTNVVQIKEWHIPRQIKYELENKKVVSIACSSMCSMIVTEAGKVYSFGSRMARCTASNQNFISSMYSNPVTLDLSRSYCDLKLITFSDAIVKKVVCGFNHMLALTDQGKLYVWGENNHGQLGTGNKTCIVDPFLLDTAKIGKLLDIAAVSTKHTSVVVNEDGCFYVWGLYAGCEILSPLATFHRNMYDVFASENIMYKPLILSANHEYTNIMRKEDSDIMRCLKNAFDNPSTSDFKVQVEKRDIHVHKAILRIRSSHFEAMFQNDWRENIENVLKLDTTFSYNVYKAYLKYLYTGVIDISPEEALDLLQLADFYNEPNLKRDCILVIRIGITSSNVAFVYKKAIEYNEEILEDFCFSFALKNMTEVIQTENFMKLDENVKNMFLLKAAKANAFKT